MISISPKKYFHILYCVLIMIFLSGAIFAQTEKKPRKRVAVLSFTAENTDEGNSRIVRNSIELSLFGMDRFDILEQQQVDDILKERKLILTDCSDEICAGEIGEILSAEFVVIGSVSKLNKFLVQVRVISVPTKKIIIADSAEVDGLADIRDASAGIAARIAEKIEAYGQRGWTYSAAVSLHYVSPLGYFADRVGTGYGITFSGRAEDIFFRRLILGVDLGYVYFNEKPGITHHSFFIPALLAAGFRIPLPWGFSIVPVVSAGTSYDIVYYYTAYKKPDFERKDGFQLMAKGAASVEYTLTRDFFLRLYPEYGAVFEEDGRLDFYSISFGTGFVF